jgi:hypothetical protein
MVQSAQYPVEDYLAGVLRQDAPRRGGGTYNQIDSVTAIAQAFEQAGLPPELAAAAIVNAYRESRLDPLAEGDRDAQGNPRSVGLFQLHDAGLGAGMSITERKDPRRNAARIAQALNERATYKAPPSHEDGSGAGPTPWYYTEHPMLAWARGVRDVGHLAAYFGMWIERPRYIQRYTDPETGELARPDEQNRRFAKLLFPDLVGAGAIVPAPGSGPPLADIEAQRGSQPGGVAPTTTRRPTLIVHGNGSLMQRFCGTPDRQLGENFSMDEFMVSGSAQDKQDCPSERAQTAIENGVTLILQPMRSALGGITVTSGYRSDRLNTAIGGSSGSRHRYGEAADLKHLGHNGKKPLQNRDLAAWFWLHRDRFPSLDQCIWYEHKGHLHLGWDYHKRGQFLRAYPKADGKTGYAGWKPTQQDLDRLRSYFQGAIPSPAAPGWFPGPEDDSSPSRERRRRERREDVSTREGGGGDAGGIGLIALIGIGFAGLFAWGKKRSGKR